MVSAEELCNELLQLDGSIRFVGIANQMGRLIGSKFRPGLQPLLERDELENYAMKAALRMKMRGDYESKLGRVTYTFALYEKVKRATIPLNDSHFSILLISFDVHSDHDRIILDKLLPQVKRHKLVMEA